MLQPNKTKAVIPVLKQRSSEVKESLSRTDMQMKYSMRQRKDTPEEIAAAREKNIKESNEARKTSWTKDNWRQKLATETQATGDKLRVSSKPNFFDDNLNPAAMIGDMASNLGSTPLRAKQEKSNMPYLSAVAAPLVTGAVGGIGVKSTKGFVNNIINPLAGSENLFTKGRSAVKRGLKDKEFLFDKEVLNSMDPKNANIIKSKYGEFTPEELKMLSPVDMQSQLVAPPKKTYRKVFDPTHGYGEFKKEILKKTNTPITSTRIAKQKALELSPSVFTHESRMNVGMSTLTNKSDALNIYGIKEYKGAEYYPYTPNNINNFHNTETWLHHFKVNADSKILDSGKFNQFNESANKAGWTQAQKSEHLKKLGYDGIKKWDDSPEIQFLSPEKNLTLYKTKRISPSDTNRHSSGGKLNINTKKQ